MWVDSSGSERTVVCGCYEEPHSVHAIVSCGNQAGRTCQWGLVGLRLDVAVGLVPGKLVAATRCLTPVRVGWLASLGDRLPVGVLVPSASLGPLLPGVGLEVGGANSARQKTISRWSYGDAWWHRQRKA